MSSSHPLVVLDTSVVSIVYNHDRRASFYEDHIEGLRAVISFQTLEEMYFWPLRNGWAERRQNQLMQHMDQYQVIWPNPALVDISARLRLERELFGKRLNTADAWIAATAVMLDCRLASHDRDFDGIPNLKLIRSPCS